MSKLAVVLHDLTSEMTDEKDLINNSVDIFQYGKLSLVAQISDVESQMVVPEAENLELKERIKGKLLQILKERMRLTACSWSLKLSFILLKCILKWLSREIMRWRGTWSV